MLPTRLRRWFDLAGPSTNIAVGFTNNIAEWQVRPSSELVGVSPLPFWIPRHLSSAHGRPVARDCGRIGVLGLDTQAQYAALASTNPREDRRPVSITTPELISTSRRLALNGGQPAFHAVPPEDQGIAVGAADEVAEVVRSGRTVYWGGGPKVKRFEAAFAARLGKRHSFFHNSGSAALVTAVFATNCGPNHPVVIGSSGFVAAVNAVYHNRARPYFIATDPRTLQATADGYEAPGERPAALLVTHFLGNVVDVPSIARVVGANYVVEDAGQAHGARLDGALVGSMSDIGSFAGSHKKLVTAGQGGCNVTDDAVLDARMRMVGHHGKSSRAVGEVPGFNFRGGEMEAVLGFHALQELDARVAARNATAAAITGVLVDAGITVAAPLSERAEPAWFDVAVVLPETWRAHRDWLVRALKAENVPVATYPSLIEMPWVKPWMIAEGWWSEREEALLSSERDLWGRVVVIGSQLSIDDGTRSAQVIADILTGIR